MTDERLKLIAEYRRRQPIEELERKAHVAARSGWWTQEDVDLAIAKAEILIKEIKWE